MGETEAPASYRVKDEIEYSIDIEEWNGTHWRVRDGLGCCAIVDVW